MRALLKGMKLLTRVVARAQLEQVVLLEREMNALIDLVDGFYDVLGSRHWIFTDHFMPIDRVTELLASSPTSEAAEAGLVEILADHIRSPYWQVGLLNHEAMRARRANLERAREHYLQKQWDSCALVLVSVMDGFINDVDIASRRGLHTREPEEMVAWDSVSGHHMGLTSVMRVYQKTFRKRHDDEVFEVHRHGIVHGTVVSYSNQIVATKAWNMLAAVVDWAAAKEKAAIAAEPKPSVRSVLALLMERAERSRYRKSFQPSTMSSGDARFRDLEVVQAAMTFLQSWQAQRWGLVADALSTPIGKVRAAPGTRAVETKRIYSGTPLGDYQITDVSFPQPSVAVISGTAEIGDTNGPIEIRWICEGADGHVAKPDDVDAKWVLATYPPQCFIKQNEP